MGRRRIGGPRADDTAPRRRTVPGLVACLGLLALGLAACDAGGGTERATDGPPDTLRTPDTIASGPAETDALVDPNRAVEQQLAAMPGLDSATVMVILRGRPYPDMLALHETLSARMDSAALDSLYRRLFIPIDLNRASREEILLIPGVGERMADELEAYRPYDGMARFRREIGQYVDDEEIGRLERYVRIR